MKQHVHFIGIGGVGMGTLASILLAKGYRVSGSDIKESQLTKRLINSGAVISIGHKPGNIDHPDCVVYSSAIRKDNPEVLAAKKKNIPVKKRARLLAQLLNKEIGITVAGAHGKTTTTAMIAHILFKAGLNPSTMVGGIIKDALYNAHLGDGKYFVAEVDESDGSFLFFKPVYCVITNIDYEHLDYYHNWENIIASYRRFIHQTRKKGCLFVYGEDPNLQKIVSRSGRNYTTYGKDKDNDIQAKNIFLNGYLSRFDCVVNKKNLGSVTLQVPGEHNILNALAALGVGLKLGIDWEVIESGLSEYRGVDRRFQLKADTKGVMVVDDYGHHPTEIISTLKAARAFNKRRLITVFQPHRYSRTKYLLEDFVKSLILSDYLILTDIYAASEKPIQGVSTEELLKKIKSVTKIPVVYLKKENIPTHLLEMVQFDDLVVFLGAGDITYVGDRFVEELKKLKQYK